MRGSQQGEEGEKQPSNGAPPVDASVEDKIVAPQREERRPRRLGNSDRSERGGRERNELGNAARGTIGNVQSVAESRVNSVQNNEGNRVQEHEGSTRTKDRPERGGERPERERTGERTGGDRGGGDRNSRA